ncbi:hypothetical protein A3860_24680 [Niastella vici]|uniref:Uncharacterized protein n=1 Tax=Niastella vici TaxID=1703345 RepID=A0A1V9FYU7_9BACT|nr:hypothetical protein [Niastella vici]OQP63539.1 hypothetical protein A3860_24680 [Niastella vici]
MKNNSNKKLHQLLAPKESSSLRMVYKNEDVINDDYKPAGKEINPSQTKAPNKLFVKEPLPLFNDYRFKAKDHDPL